MLVMLVMVMVKGYIYGDDGDDPITKVASSLGATEKED